MLKTINIVNTVQLTYNRSIWKQNTQYASHVYKNLAQVNIPYFIERVRANTAVPFEGDHPWTAPAISSV